MSSTQTPMSSTPSGVDWSPSRTHCTLSGTHWSSSAIDWTLSRIDCTASGIHWSFGETHCTLSGIDCTPHGTHSTWTAIHCFRSAISGPRREMECLACRSARRSQGSSGGGRRAHEPVSGYRARRPHCTLALIEAKVCRCRPNMPGPLEEERRLLLVPESTRMSDVRRSAIAAERTWVRYPQNSSTHSHSCASRRAAATERCITTASTCFICQVTSQCGLAPLEIWRATGVQS